MSGPHIRPYIYADESLKSKSHLIDHVILNYPIARLSH